MIPRGTRPGSPLPWNLLAVGAGAAWVFVSLYLRSPYALRVREPLFALYLAAGAAGLAWLAFSAARQRKSGRRGEGVKAAAILAIAAALAAGCAARGHWIHQQNRRLVAATPDAELQEFGRHLMVGWLGRDETLDLAARGAVAGVFLAGRDLDPGISIAEIAEIAAALQASREEAGLPPLWIATDQEGGAVAKLSPPLPRHPAPGSLLEGIDAPQGTEEWKAVALARAAAFGESQASSLAEAGVNMNFAPVVDLRPSHPRHALDLHSRIDLRAISDDPQIVSWVAGAICQGSSAAGVLPVLKHFPGLGRVAEDTHHFSPALDAPLESLSGSDWLPFQQIASATPCAVMLAHVRLSALDQRRPVSCSPAAARLLREIWGFEGLLVTDDFTMTPIFHGPGGMVAAARESLEAGIDLILVAYDSASIYDLLAGLLRGRRK